MAAGVINLAGIRFCERGATPGIIRLASINFAGSGAGSGFDYNLDFNQDFRAPVPEE